MMHEQFRQALEDGDIPLLRRMWAEASPHLPQPTTDEEAEATLHLARTQAETVSFPRRAYAHRWLTERGLPSGLPDALRPKAERMYANVVEAVGVAVRSEIPGLAPALEKTMSDAVAECYAEGKTDPLFVRGRIAAAREKFLNSAFGVPDIALTRR